MTIASEIQDTVVELLNDPEYSRAATLKRITPGSYDVATGAITLSTASASVRTLLMNYQDRFVDNELILRGDRRALLEGTVNPGPKTGDQLVIGSTTYAIINVQLIELAGTNIVFAMQVRAGG